MLSVKVWIGRSRTSATSCRSSSSDCTPCVYGNGSPSQHQQVEDLRALQSTGITPKLVQPLQQTFQPTLTGAVPSGTEINVITPKILFP